MQIAAAEGTGRDRRAERAEAEADRDADEEESEPESRRTGSGAEAGRRRVRAAAEASRATLREQGPRYPAPRIAPHAPQRRAAVAGEDRGASTSRQRNAVNSRAPAVESAARSAARTGAICIRARDRRTSAAALHHRSAARKARRSSSRSPKSRSARKARASLRTSRCPGASWSTCRRVDHIGVSRKIASDEERHAAEAHSAGASRRHPRRLHRAHGRRRAAREEEIAADMQFLYNLWLDIRQKAEKKPAPALLHHDLDIVQRILRDQLTRYFQSDLGR